jgi:hypothetical protein
MIARGGELHHHAASQPFYYRAFPAQQKSRHGLTKHCNLRYNVTGHIGGGETNLPQQHRTQTTALTRQHHSVATVCRHS